MAVIVRTKKPLRAGVPSRSLVPQVGPWCHAGCPLLGLVGVRTRTPGPLARQICDVPLSNVVLSAMVKPVASPGVPKGCPGMLTQVRIWP